MNTLDNSSFVPRLTHATPGAVYSNTPSRDWEADTDIPVGTPRGYVLYCFLSLSGYLVVELKGVCGKNTMGYMN